MEDSIKENQEFRDSEYASMYFGFTASAFSDEVFNVCNESMANSLKKFRKEISQKVNPSDILKFDKAFQKLAMDCEQNGMELTDKLKFSLESRVFQIPPNVLLDDDVIQNDFKSAEDEEELDNQILEVKQKILACKFVNKRLDQIQMQQQETLKTYLNLDKQLDERKVVVSSVKDGVDKVMADFVDIKISLGEENLV